MFWAKLMDSSYSIGYRDQGLSNPIFASPETIQSVNNRKIHKHIIDHFRPQNITIVGLGIEHNILEELLSSASFNSELIVDRDLPESDIDANSVVVDETPQTSQWAGGELRQPSSGNSKVILSYSGSSYSSKQNSILEVIKSAIENKRIENVCHRVYKSSFSDSGVFSIKGEVSEGQAGTALSSMITSVKSIGDLSVNDFEIAKLKASNDHLHSLANFVSLSSTIAKHGKKKS